MANNSGKSNQKPNKVILGRTLFLMAVCGIVAFIVLGIKLFKIQIIDHDFYEQRAVEQQTKSTTVSASRGTIYDAKGNVLAISATAYTVYVSPYEAQYYKEDIENISRKLSAILDVDYESTLEKFDDTQSWYKTIRTKIEEDLADKVREFKSENDYKCIHIEEDTKRYYPYSSLACHVIGFVGTDNYGLEGIEAKYDSYLEGTDGNIVRLKTGSGVQMLYNNYEYYYDAVDGCDMRLTIDSSIQNIIENHLEQAINDYAALDGGCCVVMDVNTGAVLGMASFDNYDLNNYFDISEEKQTQIDSIEDEDERSEALYNARLEQWRNMAISDTYEPGSVFKIITLAMAIEEGVADENSTYYCGGSMDVKGRGGIPLNCWKTAGHGSQTLKQAAQHSCNVAFVNIGLSVGAEKFYDYIDAFGLFNETDIDISGETSSVWWDKDIFCDSENLSQLAAASFGQTFNITPIQMITAVSAAVNGGYLLKPYLVSQVVDPDGNVVYSNEKTVVNRVISEETSKEVCEILEAVVGEDGGTGSNAYVAGYRIGGKTGTSEKVAQNAANEGKAKEYMVSFCGIAPADDPKIAVLLILDNPSHETGLYISGGQMAAPVVGSIMSEVLPYIGVEPQYDEDEKPYIDITVPRLIGKTVDEAETILDDYEVSIRVIGEGTEVTDQIPAVNAQIAAGSEIILYAGQDAVSEVTSVPDIRGMSFEYARNTLEDYGLYLKTSGASVLNGDVVVNNQSIESGTPVSKGTVVEATFVDESQQGLY